MKGLLFTYLLTYGGAALSLFDPFIGLLIYICFAIVKPEAMWFWAVPQGNYSRIVALALLVGWTFKGFGDWQFGKARAAVFALLGFWFWSAVCALVSENPAIGMAFVEGLSKIVLPFLVGITTIRSLKQLMQLAWVIGLSQGYVAYEMNMTYWGGYNRLLDGFADMDNNCNAIAMVTGVGLAFFLGLTAEKWWQKALAFLAAAFMTHAVLLSFSRGGMLALIVTGVVTFVLIPKRPIYFLAFALALGVGIRLAGKEVVERFDSSFTDSESLDTSARSRMELWSACWDLMQHHPVFGVGPDRFPAVAPLYGFPLGKLAHTMWLTIGAEQGFPGLGLLLSFYGLTIVRLWPYTKESLTGVDPYLQSLARMTIASLTGFAVAVQFVALVQLEMPYYIALVGAGCLKLCTVPGGATEVFAPQEEFVGLQSPLSPS